MWSPPAQERPQDTVGMNACWMITDLEYEEILRSVVQERKGHKGFCFLKGEGNKKRIWAAGRGRWNVGGGGEEVFKGNRKDVLLVICVMQPSCPFIFSRNQHCHSKPSESYIGDFGTWQSRHLTSRTGTRPGKPSYIWVVSRWTNRDSERSKDLPIDIINGRAKTRTEISQFLFHWTSP